MFCWLLLPGFVVNGSPFVETLAGVHSGMIYEEAKKFEALLGGQQWLWSKRVEMLFDFQLFLLATKVSGCKTEIGSVTLWLP